MKSSFDLLQICQQCQQHLQQWKPLLVSRETESKDMQFDEFGNDAAFRDAFPVLIGDDRTE